MEKGKTKTNTDFTNYQDILEENLKKSTTITQQTLETLAKNYDEQSELIIDVNKKIVNTLNAEPKKSTPDQKEFQKIMETFKESLEKVYELSKMNVKTLNEAIQNQVNLSKETTEKFTKIEFPYDYKKYVDEYQVNVEKANKWVMDQINTLLSTKAPIDWTTLMDAYKTNITEANQAVTKNYTKMFDFYKKQYNMITEINKTYSNFFSTQVETFNKLTKEAIESYWPTNWWKE